MQPSRGGGGAQRNGSPFLFLRSKFATASHLFVAIQRANGTPARWSLVDQKAPKPWRAMTSAKVVRVPLMLRLY